MSGNTRPRYPSRFSFQTRLTVSLSLITLVGAFVAIGLVKLAPVMAPVKQGELEQFWTNVFCVPKHDWSSFLIYQPDNQTYVYKEGHMHGSDLYRVDIADVQADYPHAFEQAREMVASGEAHEILIGAFTQLETPIDAEHVPLDELLRAISESRLEFYVKENRLGSIEYLGTEEAIFYDRWYKIKWYPTAIALEWLFLTGLATLLIWPWLRACGPIGWGVCIGIIPLLFAMPVYLGYAFLSFTSVGPSGGVLYPYIARLLLGRGSMNNFDSWLLDHIPPFLEPISQDVGSIAALSGIGLRGPTQLMIVGAVTGTLIALTVYFRNRKPHAKQCNTPS